MQLGWQLTATRSSKPQAASSKRQATSNEQQA